MIGDSCVDICGDGYLITWPCDDGNLEGGDGCSQYCQVETNYNCALIGDSRNSTCFFAVKVELVLQSTRRIDE